MTAVVTGATGHLGINLIRVLRERDRPVRALIHIHDDATPMGDLGVEQVRGDVLDVDSLRAAFEGAEVVYHLAAIISIDGDPDGSVWRTNVDGVRHVVEACRDVGVGRLVHFSSVHAFDHHPLDRPLDESRARAEGPGHFAYDRSKAAGELEVLAGIERGLDAVILNPAGIVGPYDYRPSRMGQLLLDLYHRRAPALVDGGFSWVDVRDVALAAVEAESRGRTGANYILAGPWASVRTLAGHAAEATGVPAPRLTVPMWVARLGAPVALAWSRWRGTEPLFTPEALGALRGHRDLRSGRATEELDFRPRPLAETIHDTCRWFIESDPGAARPEPSRAR